MHNEYVPLRRRSSIVLLGCLAVAAVLYLLSEHGGHVLGALPYLLLLACPLMHLFMHHGHDGHHHGSRPASPHD